jgi:FtsH-binding integral membrane protein
METTLFFKTFIVFGSQLSLIFGICYLIIFQARKAILEKQPFFGVNMEARYNSKGELDLFSIESEELAAKIHSLQLEVSDIKIQAKKLSPSERKSQLRENTKKIANLKTKISDLVSQDPFTTVSSILLIPWVFTLITCAIIGHMDISIFIKMSVLTIASVTFAPILAIILIKMDENNGLRIVNLTILVTFIAAIIGMYSGIDFSALGYILIAPLALLILWNFARIFYNFPDWQTRGMGFFGSLIFILFLLYDFNRLQKAAESGINNWQTAFEIGFAIYLDVINLLLELLDAMG